MVMLGEVQTGLLRNSVAVSPGTVAQLLGFTVDSRVRSVERPIPYAVSPELLTGVDCHLATSSGSKVRAVGTAVSRAAITGGHVVQGSAFVRIAPEANERRLPWSHYLARPGLLETIGKTNAAHLADGFLAGTPDPGTSDSGALNPGALNPGALNLGAICARTLDAVQDSPVLNQSPPFKTQRTRLRWVVGPPDHAGRAMMFRLDRDLVRSARLPVSDLDAATIATLCEDLALHDWLLTTLGSLVARARIGTGDRKAIVTRLQPALDYLLHLWMPAARIDEALVDLWEALERRPGLSRQWQATVDRIRDQLALAAVT